MKIKLLKHPNEQGNVLIIALCFALIIGISLGSYLVLAQNQYASVARSQTWNSAMVMTEAGVEDAMALLNVYQGTGNDMHGWTNQASANNWTVNGNVYYVRRYLGNNYYDVWITNNIATDNHNIKSVGATATFANALPGVLFATAGVVNNEDTRAVDRRAALITTSSLNTNSSMYLMAVLVKGGITLSGQGYVDSFNSKDPAYNTGGKYDPAKRKDGGSVGTIVSNVTAAISESGQAKIYGKAFTGPGSTVQTSGQAAIGSLDWVNGGNTGIQDDWWVNNLNVQIPDAPTAPGVTYMSLPTAVSIGDGYSAYILDGGGAGHTNYYAVPSNFTLSGKTAILITNGTIVMKFGGSFSATSQTYMDIATNASFVGYLNGNMNFAGQYLANQSGYATNCTFYGSQNCTTVNYVGQSDYIGTIYAPNADVKIAGQGGLIGAVVGNKFINSGSGNVHYDEALSGGSGANSVLLYRVASWKETAP